MNPMAQTDGLTIRELNGETLVYDTKSKKVHALNAISAWVWRHCDGTRTAADLAAGAAGQFNVPAADALVALALQQLERRGLVQIGSAPPAPVTAAARSVRREALKRLVVLAAAPLIMSVLAPQALAQISNTSLCETLNLAACAGIANGGECQRCVPTPGGDTFVPGICNNGVCGPAA